MVSTVASLVLSPILGAMVDSFTKKKTMLLGGHLGIALAGTVPLFGEAMLTTRATFQGIAVAVVLATVCSIVVGGAMDYYLKTYLPQQERARRLATLNSTMQMALILGTAIGGLIISQGDSSHVFLVVSLCGGLSAGLSWRLLPSLDVARSASVPISKRGIFSAGPMLYLRHRRLFAIASCAALVFSIGQITNTLLPALISVYLGGTSVSYSLIEAAWSAGALLVGLWLAGFAAHSPGSIRRDFAVVGAMAGVLAAVPFLSALPVLLAAHFLLGAGFSLVRMRSETRFLAECPIHLLGRFRANSLFMTSSIGLLIFATPTLCRGASVADLYMVMAGAVATSAIALFAVGCSPSPPSPR
ncbi:MAG: MFS transporter [Trinickia sp.]